MSGDFAQPVESAADIAAAAEQALAAVDGMVPLARQAHPNASRDNIAGYMLGEGLARIAVADTRKAVNRAVAAAAAWEELQQLAQRDVTPDRRQAAEYARQRDTAAADALAAWQQAIPLLNKCAGYCAGWRERIDARTTPPPPAPATRPAPAFR